MPPSGVSQLLVDGETIAEMSYGSSLGPAAVRAAGVRAVEVVGPVPVGALVVTTARVLVVALQPGGRVSRLAWEVALDDLVLDLTGPEDVLIVRDRADVTVVFAPGERPDAARLRAALGPSAS
ncbi:MAG: hypothetical protein AAF548_18995 [Actinomycetota bacterium]